MNKQFLKDSFGWGFILWLAGYALGMMFFVVVPPNLIGWFVTPIGIILALWVLFKKVKGNSLLYFIVMATVWLLIAIVFDYVFLVKAFNLSATYYKPDIYIYYTLTFFLPVIVGILKIKQRS